MPNPDVRVNLSFRIADSMKPLPQLGRRTRGRHHSELQQVIYLQELVILIPSFFFVSCPRIIAEEYNQRYRGP